MKRDIRQRWSRLMGMLALLALPAGTQSAPGDDGSLVQRGETAAVGTSLSAGEWHTCAIMSDGSLACWGLDTEGQRSVPMSGGQGTFGAAVNVGKEEPAGLKATSGQLIYYVIAVDAHGNQGRSGTQSVEIQVGPCLPAASRPAASPRRYKAAQQAEAVTFYSGKVAAPALVLGAGTPRKTS